MTLSDPTQLQRDFAEVSNRFIGSLFTTSMYESFHQAFWQMLHIHGLDDMKFAFKFERNCIVIVPLTTASQIVLMYMQGSL